MLRPHFVSKGLGAGTWNSWLAVIRPAYNRRRLASSSSGTLQEQLEQEGLVAPKNNLSVSREPSESFVVRRTQKQKNKTDMQKESRQANRGFAIAQEYLQAAENRRQELHRLPIGAFREEDWRDARKLMEYFCHRASSRGSEKVPHAAVNQTIRWSLKMLDRLVKEYQAQSHGRIEAGSGLQTYWLKMITLHWRDVYRKHASTCTTDFIHPRAFLERVEDLATQSNNILKLSGRIYTAVMDVALRQSIQNSRAVQTPRRSSPRYSPTPTQEMEETAEFIESLLGKVQASKKGPDDFAYKTAINAWELVGNGGRAHGVLRDMRDRHGSDLDAPGPNRKHFQSVLKAFARGPKSSETIAQCREIIRQMENDHREKNLDTLPNGSAFNTVLTCMAHNPQIEDPVAQAEQFLSEEISCTVRDINTYNILLEMYSHRGLDRKATNLLNQLIEEHEVGGEVRVAPNIKSFNLVLSALSKAGNSGAVEQHFRMMEELDANNIFPGVAPNNHSYSILLANYVQQVGRVPDALSRADAIVHTMERLFEHGNTSVRPTKVTYTTLMNGFAKAGNHKRAEEILNFMMESQKHYLRPDRAAFNTLLLALSRSDMHDAPQKIQEVIQQMDAISCEGTLGQGVDVRPDTRSYNSLLQAIARSGHKDAGEQCEKLMLQTMLPDPRLAPNEVSYSTLVQAYGRAGKAEQAERVLDIVCSEHHNHGSKDTKTRSKPTAQLFSSVMNAWSKSCTVEAPDRAAALLDRMKRLSEAGDLSGSIDVIVWNTLLDAWSNSGRNDAAECAETILHDMEVGAIGVAPNAISYNTVMKAWSLLGNRYRCEDLLERMGERQGVQPGADTLCTLLMAWSRSDFANDDDQAEAVLQKLNELQKTTGIIANVACYNVVLGCLSKSKTEQSCLAAEDMLSEMERLASSKGGGSESVRPDAVSYTSVIEAFANVGDTDNAERILDRLIKLYAQHNDPQLRPTTRCFNSVLKAWAQQSRQCRRSAPDVQIPPRAESLLTRMRRLHKAAGVPVKPDVISYNLVMDIWANTRLPQSSKRALGILTRMLKSKDSNLAPNTHSYNIAINAFALNRQCENAEWLLESMYESYNSKKALGDHSAAKPNIISWNSVLSAFEKSARNDSVEKAESAIEKMEVLYSTGLLEARPDTVSFNCLLRSLAKSSRENAGVRCKAILEDMESRWVAGDKNIKPDSHSFAAAIHASLKCNDLEEAQALFKKLCLAYEETGDSSMKPSIETFRLLLAAVGDKRESREKILGRMQDFYPDE